MPNPMTTNQMREYLQGYFGSPVVLRKQGTTSVKCPYCLKKHDHGLEPGHRRSHCDKNDPVNGIATGERSFSCNYSYTIVEHKEEDGVNKLLIY